MAGCTLFQALGFGCGVIFIVTLTFLTEARSISLDHMSRPLRVCFYLIYSGELLNRPSSCHLDISISGVGLFIQRTYWLGYPKRCGMYFLFVRKGFKRFIWVGIICAMLLVVCSALLYWLAMHVGGAVFAKDVLQMEVASRIHDVRSLPFYFYFQNPLGHMQSRIHWRLWY